MSDSEKPEGGRRVAQRGAETCQVAQGGARCCDAGMSHAELC